MAVTISLGGFVSDQMRYNSKMLDFSFAPVISASIQRYVNYFDIQVLMMVTETETLTSTLHHNKFTYLDYAFLLPSYCRILIHIYFHMYIYTLGIELKNIGKV